MYNKFNNGEQVVYTNSHGANYKCVIDNVKYKNSKWFYDMISPSYFGAIFMDVEETCIVSLVDWQKSLNSSNPPSNPTPKFQLGDAAVYLIGNSPNRSRPVWGKITKAFLSGTTWFYNFESSIFWAPIENLEEEDLMTSYEFQNSIYNTSAIPNSGTPWGNLNSPQNGDSFHTEDLVAKSGARCTCGAHKVKDSRHSTWCDIKN